MTAAHADASVDPTRPPTAPTAPDALLWIDGRRVDPDQPHLSAFDRGFTLGDGLFETMRVYHGVIFRLDRHLARLTESAQRIGVRRLPDIGAMAAEAVHEARATGIREAALRLTVSRGVAPRGLAPPPNAIPTVIVAVHRLLPARAAPLIVRTARARRNEFALTAGLKTLGYLESVLALADAQADGADEALFLDTAGHLCEATASNMFLVTGELLRTPPTTCGILPGITRAAVLELARATGLQPREELLLPDDLRHADEMFLTSSLREIAPVTRVDAHRMPNDAPGPVTRRLIEAFDALVERECPP